MPDAPALDAPAPVAAPRGAAVIIVGASPHGRVVLATLRASGVAVSGFVDDDGARRGSRVDEVAVIGDISWWLEHLDVAPTAIVAVGNNDRRLEIAARIRAAGVRLVNAVHPAATVMPGVRLGAGCLVAAGAVVVTGTVVGDDVIVNTGATIDHDSHLEPGAQVASGVHTAGCVTIGRGAFVGVGAVLGPSVNVGAGAVVGAGSVVLTDVPPDALAFGVPARPVRTLTRPLDWRGILAGR